MKKLEQNRLSFLILLFGTFIDWMSFGIVYPIFAPMIYSPDLHFFAVDTSSVVRGIWLGVLLAAAPLSQFFSATILGSTSDEKGRKPLLVFSSSTILFGYFLSALGVWKQSLLFLLLGRIITGFGAGNVGVINSSVADLSRSDNKTRNFALVTMSNGIGFTLGPFFGGYISAWKGFDATFVFAGILTLIDLLLLIFVYMETFKGRRESRLSVSDQLKEIGRFAFFPKTRVFLLSFFIFCVAFSYYWQFIPVTWIEYYALHNWQVANFYAYGSFFFVITSAFFVKPIARRIKSEDTLLVGWLFLGCAILLLYRTWIGLYWVAVPIQQFLLALILPTATSMLSSSVNKNRQGTALGIFQSLQSLAYGLTPLLGGALVGWSYNSPVYLGGAVMLLAYYIFYRGYYLKKRI